MIARHHIPLLAVAVPIFIAMLALTARADFLCKGLKAVRTEMSLHVLAYNFRRLLSTLGAGRLQAVMTA